MRPDSAEDRRFVQKLAKQYNLPFVYEEAQLGAGASEATARKARNEFLHSAQQAAGAKAIITAHHQDDVLETAIINMLRGTGRKGLTALASRPDIERPLLNVPKQELIAYAQDQGLKWHEDSTNQNLDYLRNYVRHKLLPKFDDKARVQLLATIDNLRGTNQELDTLLVKQLRLQSVNGKLNRNFFNQLPHNVAREVMASWLRGRGINNFDSKALERLVVAAKTARAGQLFPVLGGQTMEVKRDYLALMAPER
jgi:tRNA(Ile)-lysidine synthase